MRSWLAALVVVVVAGCGSVVEVQGPDASASKLANGETCSAGSDCASASCTDGVCCDTSCEGTCEACNLPGSLGTCSPVPVNTDPAKECMPQVLPDAGNPDGGPQINLPDAGIGAMATPCVPTCDGARACKFPTTTTSCGGQFCNSTSEVGAAVCDGQGYCTLQITECNAYVCGSNACKTSCTVNADCQADYFCNTAGECQPKKGVATSCLNAGECGSGFCDNNVCCSTDCSTVLGGNCDSSVATAGQCKCIIAGKGVCNGTCENTYADSDDDGYGKVGDMPEVGCFGDPSIPPPTGRVADQTDCGDDDSRVHPGQGFVTAANWTSVHGPQFDWNCDGSVTLQFTVRKGGTCNFCNPQSIDTLVVVGQQVPTCGGTSNTCASAHQEAYFGCDEATQSGPAFYDLCCGQGCAATGAATLFERGSLTSGGACGQASTLTVCGSCSAQNGTASPSNDPVNQGCK